MDEQKSLENKRSIGVTLFAGYFILQGFIALGYLSELGAFAFVFSVLFFCIGVGLLKLFNPARIAAMIASVISWLLFTLYTLTIIANVSAVSIINLAVALVAPIIFLFPVFFFTRPKVKEQFTREKS